MRSIHVVAAAVAAVAVALAYAYAQSEPIPAKFASRLVATFVAIAMSAGAYRAYARSGTRRMLLLYSSFTAMSARELLETYARLFGSPTPLPGTDVPLSDVVAMLAYLLMAMSLIAR